LIESKVEGDRRARSTQPFDAFEDSMLLPMCGLLLMLIILGGLACLVAAGDPHHARAAPYTGFVLLFAGLAAALCSLVLALIGVVLHSEVLSGLGFLAGYLLGGLGGALLGFKHAVKHRE
jgi:hypothetical protein